MNQVVALSGGKDSTAMLLKMLEKGESIYSVVFFDTGWEFPEMLRHIEKLRKNLPVPIHTIYPRLPFDYWMIDRPVRTKSGKEKGKIYTYGRGWPTPQRRWCTSLKINQLFYYYANVETPIVNIGYAYDEMHRSCTKVPKQVRYPLREFKMSGGSCIEYCYSKGYDWEGLYKGRERAGCYCCPLQDSASLWLLHITHPDLWGNMVRMDALIKDNRGFRNGKTVGQIENGYKKIKKRKIYLQQLLNIK